MTKQHASNHANWLLPRRELHAQKNAVSHRAISYDGTGWKCTTLPLIPWVGRAFGARGKEEENDKRETDELSCRLSQSCEFMARERMNIALCLCCAIHTCCYVVHGPGTAGRSANLLCPRTLVIFSFSLLLRYHLLCVLQVFFFGPLRKSSFPTPPQKYPTVKRFLHRHFA